MEKRRKGKVEKDCDSEYTPPQDEEDDEGISETIAICHKLSMKF